MPPENNFDADLNLLLDIARTEYKTLMVDDRSYQDGLLKTYLWLSTVMLAAIIAIGGSAIGEKKILFLSPGNCDRLFLVLWGGSLILSLAVFVLGIDTLRWRNHVKTFGNFREIFDIAKRAAEEGKKQDFKISLLRFLEETTTSQTAETSRRGLRLRKMSYMLLGSTLSGFLAVVAFALG